MEVHTAYQDFSIQTPVSIAIRTVHDNPKLFPEPEKFIPERWIETEDLDHWLVVFGKGSRSCIGLKYAISFILSFHNVVLDPPLFSLNPSYTHR